MTEGFWSGLFKAIFGAIIGIFKRNNPEEFEVIESEEIETKSDSARLRDLDGV